MIPQLILIAFLYQGPTQPSRPGFALQWWHREALMAQLSLSPQQTQTLQTKLDAFQVRFQVLQTKVKSGRARLRRNYAQPEASAQEIERLYQEDVEPHAVALMRLRMEARVWVRGHLSIQDLETLRKVIPKFFAQTWFQSSKIPVIQGKVK